MRFEIIVCCCLLLAWMKAIFSIPAILSACSQYFVLRLSANQHRLRRSRAMATLANGPVQHVDKELLPSWLLEGRTKVLTPGCKGLHEEGSAVVYWMQRDIRTRDNWALLFAAHLASNKAVPLRVIYSIPPPPTCAKTDGIPKLQDLPMTERHGKFLLGGLECVHEELKKHNIPLEVVMPSSYGTVGESVVSRVGSSTAVVVDFSPLRHHREWTELQSAALFAGADIPLYQVDTHNVVPVWVTSPKREYAARTIRPKIQKLLTLYLEKFPKLQDVAKLIGNTKGLELPPFQRLLYEDFMKMDSSVGILPWAKPGTDAGLKQAEFFIENGLKNYDDKRNDPNFAKTCSNLSAWLNHGHVSFQRLAIGIKKLNKYATASASFLEEGIVRRELSDNYVYYAPDNYDALTAAYDWAQETLRVHSEDKRENVYTLEQLSNGQTHDDLWNAAQLQAVRDGKMHGFLRMYWAKKILEWTESPTIALDTAQYLNDWYNIDGRDPNGFVGVGWSIMGIHDQGWKEREIFGKIRYMNYAGCKRKFKVPEFVARYEGALQNAEQALASSISDKKRKVKSAAGSKQRKQAKH